jgi:hypothetical protein
MYDQKTSKMIKFFQKTQRTSIHQGQETALLGKQQKYQKFSVALLNGSRL